MSGRNSTVRDWERAECGDKGGIIGKDDPEMEIEEGEMAELGGMDKVAKQSLLLKLQPEGYERA